MQEESEKNQYHIKVINNGGVSRPILLQNENGPCALIAIVNTLVLRDSPMAALIQRYVEVGSIPEVEILARLGQLISGNEEETLNAVVDILPRLSKGLDVNPKFDGSFLYSPELEAFKAFGIRLLHCWVVGTLVSEKLELNEKEAKYLNGLSYESLCVQQFSDKSGSKYSELLTQYPTQMTEDGFLRLEDMVKEGEMAILFWNNHFSTLLNHSGYFYILVTDLGFQNKPEVVWERVNITGAGNFVDGDFRQPDIAEKSATPKPKEAEKPVKKTVSVSEDKAVPAKKVPKKASTKSKKKCIIC